MITKDYVSLETAKLLQENGFDWDNSPFASTQERDEWKQKYSYTIPNADYNPELSFDSETLTMIAPHVSLQRAMKWLREEHNIHIILSINWLYFANTLGWMYTITKILENGVDYIDSKGDENDKTFYSSYEEAAEAAIKYCLENLI